MSIATTAAALFGQQPRDVPENGRTAPLDRVITAAAYIARNWGEYGYGLSIEQTTTSWTLFRGHHYDGSNFWFVVDRDCNVADVDVPR